MSEDLTVEPSRDTAYFREVLARPGMRRAAGGGLSVSPDEMAAALEDRSATFFLVRGGSRKLGFMVFLWRAPQVAELHTCLLTLGQRTRRAVQQGIRAVGDLGAKVVVAFYPPAHRAAERVLSDLGFMDAPDLAQCYPEPIRTTYRFKEVLCLG